MVTGAAVATCGITQSEDRDGKSSDSEADLGTWHVAKIPDQSSLQIEQNGITERQARRDLGAFVITGSGIEGDHT